MTPDKNMGRAAIEGWITLDAAKKILAMAGQDFDALKKQAATREFKPVAARPQGVARDPEHAAHDRLAERRRQARRQRPALKDEYVVYSAHWDHLGVGTPVKGDKIYNGALDNASGVATVLEIARAFTQVQPAPKRSILFLMVTAEEQGLLGSQYYAINPLYPLDKTARQHQHRRRQPVGTDERPHGRRHGRVRARRLRARRRPPSRDARCAPDPEPEKGFYYRSDHFNFAKQGVPALDPDAGIDFVGKPPDYGKQKRDEYTEQRLPRAVGRDEARLGSLRRRRDDAELLFAVGYRVANADKFPEWKPGNEFKAKRDAMLKKSTH